MVLALQVKGAILALILVFYDDDDDDDDDDVLSLLADLQLVLLFVVLGLQEVVVLVTLVL